MRMIPTSHPTSAHDGCGISWSPSGLAFAEQAALHGQHPGQWLLRAGHIHRKLWNFVLLDPLFSLPGSRAGSAQSKEPTARKDGKACGGSSLVGVMLCHSKTWNGVWQWAEDPSPPGDHSPLRTLLGKVGA